MLSHFISGLLREFQLRFSEEIVFHQGGQFELKQGTLGLFNFLGNSTNNWYLSDGTGGADSVLNFKIALPGLFKLSMNNDAVQDVAGNVALVGTREWSIDLLRAS